jgi:hypothetical protein
VEKINPSSIELCVDFDSENLKKYDDGVGFFNTLCYQWNFNTALNSIRA